MRGFILALLASVMFAAILINDTVFIYRNFSARKANIDFYTDDEDNPSVLGFDLRRLPAIPQ